MNDLLYDALDVAIALREVEGAELGRGLVVVGVRFELFEQRAKLQYHVSRADKMERTIACDRLCARMTLPMADSKEGRA